MDRTPAIAGSNIYERSHMKIKEFKANLYSADRAVSEANAWLGTFNAMTANKAQISTSVQEHYYVLTVAVPT